MNHKRYMLISILLVLGMILAACGPAPTPVTVVETVVVEKEGETIIQTVEVEKTVIETVEVEKTVEVIVDPTECNLEPPAEAVEINMIGWSFPITDYYAEELEKCSKVENLTVNTSLLASADAQEQVRLALSAGAGSAALGKRRVRCSPAPHRRH